MSRPVWDGPGDGCGNTECHATREVAPVAAVEEMYPGLSSSDGPIDWPVPEGVTHLCTSCGFTYYGTTDAYGRRLDAQQRRRAEQYEANNERHESYVADGYDPVCGNGFTDDGWDRIQSELTPARSLLLAINRMPRDVSLDAIAFFADHHVTAVGRNYVESRLADVVEKHAEDWGYPALVEYDAFTATAADFM